MNVNGSITYLSRKSEIYLHIRILKSDRLHENEVKLVCLISNDIEINATVLVINNVQMAFCREIWRICKRNFSLGKRLSK